KLLAFARSIVMSPSESELNFSLSPATLTILPVSVLPSVSSTLSANAGTAKPRTISAMKWYRIGSPWLSPQRIADLGQKFLLLGQRRWLLWLRLRLAAHRVDRLDQQKHRDRLNDEGDRRVDEFAVAEDHIRRHHLA